MNPLCGRWTVPRLCMTYPRLSPGGDQMVARPSSDCRRTDVGLSLHCASYLLGYPWAAMGLPLGSPLGSPLAAPWQLYGSPNSSNGSQNSSNGAQNVSNGTHEPVQRGAQTRPMAHANSSNGAHKLVQCSVATHGVAPKDSVENSNSSAAR